MIQPIIEALPSWFAGGAGLGAGFFVVRWLFEWASGRIDKREAAVEVNTARVDAATAALIDRLERRLEHMDARVEQLERELDECRKRDAEQNAELIRLKAMMQGLGDARDRVQRIVADEVVAIKRGATK